MNGIDFQKNLSRGSLVWEGDFGKLPVTVKKKHEWD
jgi:hypothetical protein